MTADEFVDLLDELCFKHKFEIVPVRYLEMNFISVVGETDSVEVLYIDGDGRGK